MIGLVVRFIIQAVVFMVLSNVFDGIQVMDFESALLFAVILALADLFIRPLLGLFEFGLNVVTLGCLSVIIAFIFDIVIIAIVDSLVAGVHFDGWVPMAVVSIVMSVVGGLLNRA